MSMKITVNTIAFLGLLIGSTDTFSLKKTIPQSPDVTLVFAADIIRHGVRAPIKPIQGQYAIEWENVSGGILPEGIHSEYQLGQEERKDYLSAGLIPSTCTPIKRCLSIIYAQSSDIDRTLISAQSFLLGLFSQNMNSIRQSKTGLPNQITPVPVHTVPKKDDNLLLVATQQSFKEAAEALTGTAIDDPWALKNHEKLERAAGTPIQHRIDIIHLGDALTMRAAIKAKMPISLSESDIQKVITLYHRWYIAEFENRTLARQVAKPIILKIGKAAYNRIHNHNPVKILLLSGHDDNLMGILESLGSHQTTPPHPASIISFRFYQKIGRAHV